MKIFNFSLFGQSEVRPPLSISSSEVRPPTNHGFTLVEMLVVIAIISLLTGIVMTGLVGSKSKSRDAKRISDLGQIQMALELYFDRCKEYPVSDSGLITSVTLTKSCSPASGVTVPFNDYISTIPTPPAGASQTSYGYATKTVGATVVDYALWAVLENTNEIVKDGLPSDYINGTDWSVPIGIGCDNSPGSKHYCLGPK